MKAEVCYTITLCAAWAVLQVQARAEIGKALQESNRTHQGNHSLSQDGNESASVGLYDCHAPNPERWASNHSDWCCQYEGMGCRFDCMAAYSNREVAWSDSKKAWCCKNRQLGCEGLKLSDQPYDCQKTYWGREDWSQEQQEWCCYHKQLGCFSHTTAMAAQHSTTTGPSAIGRLGAAAPTVATTSTTGAQEGADSSDEGCLEDQTAWEPLDMPGTVGSQAANASECQQRCANTTGCVHFTFWWLGKNCHLQDAYAVRQTARLGFVSGPFSCWKDLDQSKYVQKGGATFVTKSYKCVELATLYTPLMGLVKHIPSEKSGDHVEAVKSCRAYCAATEGCAHFTLIFPQRLCRLAGSGAHKLERYQGAVSGTPTCWGGLEHEEDEKVQVDDGELEVIMKTSLRARASRAQQGGRGVATAAVLLFAALAVVAGMVVVAKRSAMVRPYAFSWLGVE